MALRVNHFDFPGLTLATKAPPVQLLFSGGVLTASLHTRRLQKQMTGAELIVIRRRLGDRTQDQMAELLGVSLIGLKRYETDARPIPEYIARSVRAMELCHKQNLLQVLEQMFKKDLK